MQLKLLNFYKMIANIANNLVGAFVPLIIFEATQSLVYACLFLFGCNIAKLLTSIVLYKHIQKKPEIFLLLRFFTLGIYCVCLHFLSINLILFAILGAVFLGMDTTFRTLSNETLFNYASSIKVDSKNIAMTRIFEQLGVFAGIIVGGLLLDVSQFVVYILAIIFYFIAIIPLFMYYIRNRKQTTFNSEYVSNATMFLSKNNAFDGVKKSVKYIGLSMLMCYGLIYMLYGMCDSSTNLFNLGLFSGGGISYSYASMFVLTFNISYCVGNLLVGKLEKKYDLLKIVRVICFVIAGMVLCLAFIKNIIILFICFAIFGFVYSFLCAFMLQRFLQKSRILGISNRAFVIREWSSVISYLLIYCTATVISAFGISIFMSFILTAISMIVVGIVLPKIEEKTRKMLVDFVEENEIGLNN